MNCQEALNLLYDIIDKEASEIDVKQVEKHLEKCCDCFEKYRLETEIHNFLAEKIREGKVEAAHENLKAKILDGLDAIDRADEAAEQSQGKARENPRPFRRAAITLVAAASVLLVISAGLFGLRYHSHQTRFVPLEQSHWGMTEHVRDGSMADADQTAADALRLYGYELDPVVGEFRLVGGQPEVIMDTNMLHFVYASAEKTVSVFLAPAEWFERVNDDRMKQIIRNSIQFYDHNCRDCRIVFHRVGDTMVVTASTDRDVDLLDFVPGRTVI